MCTGQCYQMDVKDNDILQKDMFNTEILYKLDGIN